MTNLTNLVLVGERYDLLALITTIMAWLTRSINRVRHTSFLLWFSGSLVTINATSYTRLLGYSNFSRGMKPSLIALALTNR